MGSEGGGGRLAVPRASGLEARPAGVRVRSEAGQTQGRQNERGPAPRRALALRPLGKRRWMALSSITRSLVACRGRGGGFVLRSDNVGWAPFLQWRRAQCEPWPWVARRQKQIKRAFVASQKKSPPCAPVRACVTQPHARAPPPQTAHLCRVPEEVAETGPYVVQLHARLPLAVHGGVVDVVVEVGQGADRVKQQLVAVWGCVVRGGGLGSGVW